MGSYGDQCADDTHHGRDENDEQEAKGGAEVRVALCIGCCLKINARQGVSVNASLKNTEVGDGVAEGDGEAESILWSMLAIIPGDCD